MNLTNHIIIVTEEDDVSSQNVVSWLKYLDCKFILLTEKDKAVTCEVKLNLNTQPVFRLKYPMYTIDSTANNVYWFRRGFLAIEPNSVYHEGEIGNHLKSENQTLLSFIYWIIRKYGKSVDTPLAYSINKLVTLFVAQDSGLNIPSTLVCNDKSPLSLFFKKDEIVTKSIQDYLEIKYKGDTYMNYTSSFVQMEIPETFFSTQFQKQIKKHIDVRVFYCFNRFYSMAIDTQKVKRRKTDFRLHYNDISYETRQYKLSPDVKKKLLKVIKHFGLDTCSIDMIEDTNGQLYFIEINPVGQFDFLSYNCGYEIEKTIACELIKKLQVESQ